MIRQRGNQSRERRVIPRNRPTRYRTVEIQHRHLACNTHKLRTRIHILIRPHSSSNTPTHINKPTSTTLYNTKSHNRHHRSFPGPLCNLLSTQPRPRNALRRQRNRCRHSVSLNQPHNIHHSNVHHHTLNTCSILRPCRRSSPRMRSNFIIFSKRHKHRGMGR